MAKNLFFLYLLLIEMVRLGGAASISPKAYWKLKLPYTPMPQSILNSLAPAPEQAARMAIKGVQPTAKESLASINGYIGLLSYRKSSLKSLNPRYLSYDNQGLDSNNPKYLSYNNQFLVSTNNYGGLLAYDKNGLHVENPKYLSYNTQGLISTNQYDALLSYDNKKGLDSNNQKYLAYNNKEGLISTNQYGSLLSYDNKKGLDTSDQKYLSYNKQGLSSTSGYIGLLSYQKAGLDSNNRKYLSNKKQALLAPGNSGSYDSLLSYKVQPNQAGYGGDSFSYKSRVNQAKETSHVDDNSATKDQVFFVEKDLHLGTKMTLHFQKGTRKGMFLPREVSNQIPFQSNKIQETLKILSLDPKSKEADVLSKRIELCEEPTIKGVEKKCVTSLESMVDYVTSMIGTNVKALTTQVEKESQMEYTFKGVKKLVKDDHETVVCHKMGYPYAVFFCHRTTTIRSYLVTLVGKDGSKIEAVAACHKESNDFLDNYAKNVLKVVPGSTHICHFPPAEDTIIWVPKN